MPTVDVVVPTHSRPDLLRGCLDSLSRQTLRHRVVVVRDGPGEETEIEGDHPEAEIVSLGRSRGFAAAANAGVLAGEAELVVLLNDDVTAEAAFVERIVEPFAEPGVGMVAPLLLRPDGTIDSFGLEADFTLAVFPRLWGMGPEAVEAERGDTILGPAGAGGAYRRQALEQVGGLDERLVSYNEDADLALRLRAAGWSCAAAPAARAVHLGSASFGHRSSEQLYRLGFSRAFMLRKYRVIRNARRAARALLSEAGSVAYQLARNRDAAGLRGRVAGWRSARPELPFPAEPLNRSITARRGIARRRSFQGG